MNQDGSKPVKVILLFASQWFQGCPVAHLCPMSYSATGSREVLPPQEKAEDYSFLLWMQAWENVMVPRQMFYDEKREAKKSTCLLPAFSSREMIQSII